MQLGPILKPTILPVNPLKPLAVKTTHARHQIMFGGAFPVPMQADIVEYSIDLPVMASDGAAASTRALVAQILELATNADWQIAGIYLTMREDLDDAQDGFYGLGAIEAPEEFPAERGWLTARVDVLLRARRPNSIGTFVDQKLQPNDFGLGGVGLGAYPQGVGQGYPVASHGLVGEHSTIYVVENPPDTMKAPFIDPTANMSLGRCYVTDEA